MFYFLERLENWQSTSLWNFVGWLRSHIPKTVLTRQLLVPSEKILRFVDLSQLPWTPRKPCWLAPAFLFPGVSSGSLGPNLIQLIWQPWIALPTPKRSEKAKLADYRWLRYPVTCIFLRFDYITEFKFGIVSGLKHSQCFFNVFFEKMLTDHFVLWESRNRLIEFFISSSLIYFSIHSETVRLEI